MATPNQSSAQTPPATTEQPRSRDTKIERAAVMTILEALDPFDAETQLRALASAYAMLDPRAARAALAAVGTAQKTETRSSNTSNGNQRSNGNNARA